MIVFALWTIAGLAGLCAILIGVQLKRSEELLRVLEIQLVGLGQTHLQGLEIVTQSLERLEKRVTVLEGEVL